MPTRRALPRPTFSPLLPSRSTTRVITARDGGECIATLRAGALATCAPDGPAADPSGQLPVPAAAFDPLLTAALHVALARTAPDAPARALLEAMRRAVTGTPHPVDAAPPASDSPSDALDRRGPAPPAGPMTAALRAPRDGPPHAGAAHVG